jgi:hypothetical protein
MGFEIPGFKLGTQRAATDLSADRYRFVVLNTTGKIARLNTAGGKALGVLQSPAKADEAAEVTVSGVTKMVAGAAIANTGPVTSDAQGRVITAASGNAINGIALETASAAGDVIAVLLGYGGAQA